MATSISSISQQKDKIHPTPHPYLMLLPQEKQYFFILLVTWTFFHVIQPWTQKPQNHNSQAFTSSTWLAWQMAHLTTTSLQVRNWYFETSCYHFQICYHTWQFSIYNDNLLLLENNLQPVISNKDEAPPGEPLTVH